MYTDDYSEPSAEEIREAVKKSLEYLLEEGMIVEENKKYRLKTEQEIKKEIQDILNSQ